MVETQGKKILSALRKKWLYKAMLSQFFTAFAITVFVSAILYKLFFLPFYWSLPGIAVLFLLIAVINPYWKISDDDVSKYLNSTQPSLEESTHLVLKPQTSLNFLEKLQAARIEHVLLSVKIAYPFKKQFALSLIALSITLVATVIIIKAPLNTGFSNRNTSAQHSSFVNPVPEIILPEIKNATIIIKPPSYTGKSLRQQNAFNIVAEEGAVVLWQIKTNLAARDVSLIFNRGKKAALSADVERSIWKTQLLIEASGFYQLKIDDKLSEFYKIEVLKDVPPAITIQSPGRNTFITYGMPEKLLAKIIVTDDYGISSANITATISSGQGEAVKFKEQKLSFNNFVAGSKNSDLQRLIDCRALGMVPGDELYFFISATDNHSQQSRSDVYIVTLQDTTGLMSMDGMAMNLDIKTELFRSQRQIIIETEQLLKNRSTISVEAFTKKSNDLGIDQNLLRLRYGKFLGEEAHTEGGDEEEDNEHLNRQNNSSDIIKKYGHEHDNAEDATFFDPATKKQLKAMFNEMWNAELKLRTFLPKDALPYEYKALLLLKDLQQKSRVYVQKTGIKVTPLNPGKRLTGNLSMINQAVTRENVSKPDSATSIARTALGILEKLRTNNTLNVLSVNILQQAFQQLSKEATNQPAAYLTSLSALKKILNENYKAHDISSAEQGFQKMIAAAEKLPYANSNGATNLSKQYFLQLNKGGRQ